MNLFNFFFKRIIVFLVFSCFIMTSAIAQEQAEKKKSEFWKQVRFGGSIGFSFGGDFFGVSLAPSGIYQFNEQFAFGVGLNFSYNSVKNESKSTIIGGSLIGLYSPIPEIQLSAELEQLHVSQNFDEGYLNYLNSLPENYTLTDTNYLVPALFVGAGYRTQNVTIGLRYDLLYNERTSIYAKGLVPFIRVYF